MIWRYSQKLFFKNTTFKERISNAVKSAFFDRSHEEICNSCNPDLTVLKQQQIYQTYLWNCTVMSLSKPNDHHVADKSKSRLWSFFLQHRCAMKRWKLRSIHHRHKEQQNFKTASVANVKNWREFSDSKITITNIKVQATISRRKKWRKTLDQREREKKWPD